MCVCAGVVVVMLVQWEGVRQQERIINFICNY
jgi:hypothetical protein